MWVGDHGRPSKTLGVDPVGYEVSDILASSAEKSLGVKVYTIVDTNGHGISLSVSRKGNPYDNAMVESFMRSAKTEEVLHQRQHRHF